jgi:nicotinamidase-related amidase
MTPEAGDVVIVGKTGLSAFPNSDLEERLKSDGIETLALGGFMANCCVESTMREAYEKGFNVITLSDCVATTSAAGLHSPAPTSAAGLIYCTDSQGRGPALRSPIPSSPP